MAKITVAGNACVITSAFTLEQLQTIQKYRPKAMTLMGGENNKEVLFKVSVGKGDGDIGPYGATFGAVTHDEQALACITVCLGTVNGDVKDYVADKFGYAVANLNKLEDTFDAVLNEIGAEKEQILGNITIAQ